MAVLLNASTAVFQPLTQVSNAAASTGLTSGFGMGPGRALSLWPACLYINKGVNLTFLLVLKQSHKPHYGGSAVYIHKQDKYAVIIFLIS